MKMIIPTADDTGHTLETEVGHYLHYAGKEYVQRQNTHIRKATNRMGEYTKEPIHDGIYNWFKHQLNHNNFKTYDYHNNIESDVTIEFVFSNYSIMITKVSNFKMNGQSVSKKNICHVLARLAYATVNDKDRSSIRDRFFQLLSLPHNVSYALENKVPFHWYKEGIRVDVRLNVNLISDDEVAIEISDGVWGAMSVKELDVMLNYFIHNQKRSEKWTYASPKTLFKETMGRDSKDYEYDLMLAFLEQNRTSKLVEDRARQLLEDMLIQYKDRMFKTDKPIDDGEMDKIHIRIRGIENDWLLVENRNGEGSRQRVSTYRWENSRSSNEMGHFLNGRWTGPICIDNMVGGSSLGDQFASRILALLNDKHTVARVSTLRGKYDALADKLPLTEVTTNTIYKLSKQLTKLCSICHDFVTTTEEYDMGSHIVCSTETKGLNE